MIPHISQGNDFTLQVPFLRFYMQNGNKITENFNLTKITNMKVFLITENNYPIETSFNVSDNILDVIVNKDLPTTGYLGLEINGIIGERKIRSYKDRFIKIVEVSDENISTPLSNGKYETDYMIIQ
jgi:hypothetical protein